MLIVHIPSWFPSENKPLDGNFILKHIASTTAFAQTIVMHHVGKSWDSTAIDLPSSIIFYPIYVPEKISKYQLFLAYIHAFDELITQYGKPDIIHAHVALPLGIVASKLSRKYQIPLALTEHWSIYSPLLRKKISFAQRVQMYYLFRRVRHLTIVTHHLHQMMMETLPMIRKIPATIVSNVVDTNLFVSQEKKERTYKQILHVSTLDPIKNIFGILRSVEKLASQRQDFRLNIVHELPNKEIENYIQTHHLGDFVFLLGKKSAVEVAAYMQQSDFLVLFSNYETQSCVLLESFCCGRPAVTSRVGGIPEIANIKNALFVEAQNESQLVEKMNYMLDHFADFDVQTIQNEAVNICSPAVVGEQFHTIYQSLINH